MCDERERLIAYVYGEAEGAERRAIEKHLNECPECRSEIAGLQATRQDLLAWDVPKHEPIWRPLAPVAPRSVWQQIPAWAMAAAAGLVFTTGVAGGLAARLLTNQPVSTVASSASPAEAVVQPVAAPSVTPDQLAAIEARVLERVRSEMRQELVAFRSAAGSARSAVDARNVRTSSDVSVDGLNRRVAVLEELFDDQVGLNLEFNNRLGGISSRARSLDNDVSLLRQVAFASGGR